MADSKLTTASVLAFERKLDVSDGLFFSGNWGERDRHNNWPEVTIREKSVRGTISNRLKAKGNDPAKVDAEIQNPNLQTVDVAALPSTADTLKLSFTLRVLGGAGKPSACNNYEYQQKLLETINQYTGDHGFETLASRYACNLANGRFLWRNRIGAEAVEVRISHLVNGAAGKSWIFNGLDFSLRDFQSPANAKQALSELSEIIAAGLSGKQHVLLEVVAFSRLGNGQEVFPSQELILDKGQSKKSKTLYQVGTTAGMHSQKLGNALRTIDTWYPDAEDLGPIAVEPYGSVTTEGRAYRQPREKVDFYSLLDNWVLKDKVPDVGNQHFVAAVVVRGGVFGEGGK